MRKKKFLISFLVIGTLLTTYCSSKFQPPTEFKKYCRTAISYMINPSDTNKARNLIDKTDSSPIQIYLSYRILDGRLDEKWGNICNSIVDIQSIEPTELNIKLLKPLSKNNFQDLFVILEKAAEFEEAGFHYRISDSKNIYKYSDLYKIMEKSVNINNVSLDQCLALAFFASSDTKDKKWKAIMDEKFKQAGLTEFLDLLNKYLWNNLLIILSIRFGGFFLIPFLVIH